MAADLIIKPSDGRVIRIFKDKGICVSNLLNKPEQYEILLENGYGGFSAAYDSAGALFILCQDNEGGIILLCEDNKAWRKYTLLQSRSKTLYEKNFTLVMSAGWMNAFYTVDYKGKTLLSHQILDNSEVPPFVIDCISDSGYRAFKDYENNIVAVYNSEYSDGSLGIKVYKWNSKLWTDFKSICKGKYVHAIADRKGNIYILHSLEGIYSLTYMSKNTFKDEYEEKNRSLKSLMPPSCNPMMLLEHGRLWVMWKQNNDVYGRYSTDYGENFSEITRFVTPRGSISTMFTVVSDESTYELDKCYGYISSSMPNIYVYSDLYKPINVFKQQKGQASEIEEFAGLESHGEPSSEQIETQKLKMQLDKLSKEVERLAGLVNEHNQIIDVITSANAGIFNQQTEKNISDDNPALY